MDEAQAVRIAVGMVREEALRAITIHSPMRSGHEGYAVIKEELDELWTAIKRYPRHETREWRKEASHLGAMAVRFIADLCLEEGASDAESSEIPG